MKYLTSLTVSISGIFAHKLRSFLTVLGVAIGIGAFIAMMAIGQGAERSVIQYFTQAGSNLLYVVPGTGFTGSSFVTGAQGSGQTLTYEDALAIAESTEMHSLNLVIPASGSNTQVIAPEGNINASVSGTVPIYASGLNKILAEGTFFTQDDINNKEMVCVLGSKLAKDLFGETNPLGEKVRVKGRSFKVIGIFESDGQTQYTTADNTMFIPITTEVYRIDPQYSAGGGHLVSSIIMQAVSKKEINDAITQITTLLRERHKLKQGDPNDFTIYNANQYMNMQNETSQTIKTLLKYISIMALIIAGIGIMNIMLVSVTERTREIGIRKAVGAKKRHILVQFWLEATTISIIGGIIGIGVGFLLSKFVFTGFKINQMYMTTAGITPVIRGEYILWSFFIAIGVGIVSGIYPAWRAARLNPIESLRYE
jgi:putative ABC transport system permease protein